MAYTDYNRYLIRHRSWEDFLFLAIGVIMLISPIFVAETYSTSVYLSAGIAGCAVAAIAMLELVSLRRWEEVLELACGIWLIAAPWILGFGGAMAGLHITAGIFVGALAILELWQDRRRNFAR